MVHLEHSGFILGSLLQNQMALTLCVANRVEGMGPKFSEGILNMGKLSRCLQLLNQAPLNWGHGVTRVSMMSKLKSTDSPVLQ